MENKEVMTQDNLLPHEKRDGSSLTPSTDLDDIKKPCRKTSLNRRFSKSTGDLFHADRDNSVID